MITLDYELFMRILFVMFVLHGALLIIVGVLNIEVKQHYDTATSITGIILLILAAWVVL